MHDLSARPLTARILDDWPSDRQPVGTLSVYVLGRQDRALRSLLHRPDPRGSRPSAWRAPFPARDLAKLRTRSTWR